jgi:1,4-dihydroxy-6-naphthoate synthase
MDPHLRRGYPLGPLHVATLAARSFGSSASRSRAGASVPRRVRIRIGHSPDPDDAFMFWALAESRVDVRGFECEQVLADIQTLNQWARAGRLEVTALSLAAYPFVQEDYALLPHGASIGSGYGPVVVARAPLTLDELRELEIVVPGGLTTSFLVLRLVLGDFRHRELPFEEIPDAVASGRAEAGLLIHEGQLTFESYGLVKILDLGEWWLLETGLPLPLGVNAARRDLGPGVLHDVSEVLGEAIQCALDNRAEALEYALQFGRGIDAAVADRFVSMYVNDLTQDYGREGRQAVTELLRRGEAIGAFPSPVEVDFVS